MIILEDILMFFREAEATNLQYRENRKLARRFKNLILNRFVIILNRSFLYLLKKSKQSQYYHQSV